MNNIIYTGLTVLLLLQGCGSDDTRGNGEDLNANTEENASVTRGTTETIDVDDLATIQEPNFIDLPIYPTFSRVNTNIVKEEHSNLYWQDNRAAQTTRKKFTEAENYCATLILDEITSWRLPTYNELLSIVNYERRTSAIYDTFQNTNDKEYWTQTKSASNGRFQRWTIHFNRGIVHFATGGYATGQSATHNVRCVSDEFANKRFKERDLSRSGDIVTDNIHKLLWQDSLNVKVDKHSFSEADAYCDNLSFGGLTSGWRLPTVKELASLIDVKAYNAAIDGNVTNVSYSDAYWTNNNTADGTSSGSDFFIWHINFEDGVISRSGKAFDKYVRCVRNSQ